MPLHSFTVTKTQKSCADPECEGHDQRPVTVELWTKVWTQREGNDHETLAITRTETGMAVPEQDRVCEYCGQPNNVMTPVDPNTGYPRRGPDPQVMLPPYHQRKAHTPDEILPARPRLLTVEERVAVLERQVAELQADRESVLA